MTAGHGTTLSPTVPGAAHLRIETGAPLSRCTTWRIGGPAEYLIRTSTADDIVAAVQWAKDECLPVTLIGGGSNLLISDNGVPGLVIVSKTPGERSDKLLTWIDEGDSVLLTAGAQAPLSWVGRFASERGCSGLDWGVGLPGTIGGATVNNAGAHGTEMKDHLVSIRLLSLDGSIKERDNLWLNSTYRNTRIKAIARPRDMIVLSTTMRLPKGNVTDLTGLADEHAAYRKATQPTGACAGSTFTNPPDDFSGRLLEVAGLKGFAIGPVSFSTKHSNFIVNAGGGTAAQVLELIDHGRSVVQELLGIQLETEIEYLGVRPENA